ncbi:hypothetical protein XENORESO_008149 [Xenotaenia resolanae]|uniref:Uncharacterized protein n=1 Tax=Xenotaenia resolanae TaxID=208358 RepID=A0ABV0VPG4_9TELE
MGSRGHLCSPDCFCFVFDFLTVWPRSEQRSPPNQMVIDGLAAIPAFAVIYTFLRCRLHKEIISVILFSPILPLLIIHCFHFFFSNFHLLYPGLVNSMYTC